MSFALEHFGSSSIQEFDSSIFFFGVVFCGFVGLVCICLKSMSSIVYPFSFNSEYLFPIQKKTLSFGRANERTKESIVSV